MSRTKIPLLQSDPYVGWYHEARHLGTSVKTLAITSGYTAPYVSKKINQIERHLARPSSVGCPHVARIRALREKVEHES